VLEILPTADVDLGAAQEKRERKRAELHAEIARAEGKLANDSFVAKAPPAVVEAERAKLSALREELDAL
jgi:valyl-tRNA synthetase